MWPVNLRKAKLTTIGTGVLLLLLAVAPVASAASSPAQTLATRFAVGATSYQNASIAKAMALVPDGTRVSACRVEWDHDRMVFGVAASPHGQVTLFPQQSVDNCAYGYACVFNATLPGANEGASCESSWLNGEPYFCQIADLGLGKIRSWVNFTSYRAWLQENDSHTNPGNEFCEKPRISNSTPSVDGNFTGPNEEDGWIWMSNNSAGC